MSTRPGMTAGILPEREGLDGQLRKLRSEAESARRVYLQRRSHAAEIQFARTEQAVEDFLEQHPELVVRYSAAPVS